MFICKAGHSIGPVEWCFSPTVSGGVVFPVVTNCVCCLSSGATIRTVVATPLKSMIEVISYFHLVCDRITFAVVISS